MSLVDEVLGATRQLASGGAALGYFSGRLSARIEPTSKSFPTSRLPGYGLPTESLSLIPASPRSYNMTGMKQLTVCGLVSKHLATTGG
jgi:hypothetical protein